MINTMGFIDYCNQKVSPLKKEQAMAPPTPHLININNLLNSTIQNNYSSISSSTSSSSSSSASSSASLSTPTPTVTPCPISAPLIVTIVGLPCRGKSLAANKIARHLCWKGESTKVFTVDVNATVDTLTEIQKWFNEGNTVAIIDGIHLTFQSRQFVIAFCADKIYHHLLVEFTCDIVTLEDNINETAQFYCCSNNTATTTSTTTTGTSLSNNKNYFNNKDNGGNIENWIKNCLEKEEKLQNQYEPCQTIKEGSLITVNSSNNPMIHSVTARGVQGTLQTSILGVLSSPVIKNQLYYFSRHGESDYNVLGRIGGDADLSARGRNYSDRLTKYLTSVAGVQQPKLIWTSKLCRTVHTVEHIPGPRAAIDDLNEINAGICEGLTYEEIQERFPQEFAWRDQDKLNYRYPHGESYLDLLQRVDNVVQALLTKTDVLVVSHQAVLRCIMAYFHGSTIKDVPYINVPLHTLLVVRSYGYEFRIETIPLKVECVDTYRIQPKNCSPERTDADALDTVPLHFDMPLPNK